MAPKKARDYFIVTGKLAECKLCSKKVAHSSNTTNLWSHLSSTHRITKSSMETANHPPAKNKAVCPSPSSSTSSSALNVTDDYSDSLTSASQNDVLSFPKMAQPTLKTVFAREKAYQAGGHLAKKIEDALLFMICKDNLSLETPEKEGFQFFAQSTVPLWKPISRATLTRRLEEKYSLLSKMVKQELASAPSFCMTADCWTEKHTTTSYLGLTVHYPVENEIKSVVLGVEPLWEQHTSDFLVIQEFAEKWSLDFSKLSVFITDGAANIVKAARVLVGPNRHITCFAHTLNLVPAAAMGFSRRNNENVPNIPGIPDLLNKVRDIVAFSHRSSNFANEIKRIQREKGIPEGKILGLIQDVITRWGSTFDMCDKFLDVQDIVSVALLKFRDKVMLTGSEIEALEILRDLLRPFSLATTEISSERNTTLSKVIPLVMMISKKIDDVQVTDNTLAANVKKFLQSELEKRFGNIEDNLLFGMATILDPRYMKVHFKTNLRVSKAMTLIEREVVKNLKSEDQKNQEEPTATVEEKCSESGKDSLWESHDKLMVQHKNRVTPDDYPSIARTEMRSFFAQELSERHANPLEIWSFTKHQFPNLFKLARIYLSALATSVPSERLFSLAGHIMQERRASLSTEHLQQRIFLASIDAIIWKNTM